MKTYFKSVAHKEIVRNITLKSPQFACGKLFSKIDSDDQRNAN